MFLYTCTHVHEQIHLPFIFQVCDTESILLGLFILQSAFTIDAFEFMQTTEYYYEHLNQYEKVISTTEKKENETDDVISHRALKADSSVHTTLYY